jgi:hypothetical protein
MFLAESLNQKLKSTLEKYELNRTNNVLFPYTKPHQNPKVLEIQRNYPEITREQLQDLTNEEFLNKFTVQKLHKKWQRRFPYNYGITTKKFSDDCTSKEAQTAKAYIKDLLDRDIFEVKIPRWNKSTKPDFTKAEKEKVPLKKTLFEVNNGFNNYLVTPLKNKFVEEGTDSRNIHIFGDDWNVSSKLEKNEKKLLDTDLFIKSMNNTQKYWRSKNYYRMNEMELPISSERKQVEEPRYYKQYQNPRSLTIYNYEKMKRAKNDLWLEKEKIYKEEKIKNLGSVPEKINCIVEKRMFPKYKERFEIITGKKKEIINDSKKKTHWKDDELMEKIELINNWKDTNWFHPNKTFNPEMKKRELLKQLVPNKDKILREQDRLKEEKISENKRKIKHDLMEQKHLEIKQKKINPIQLSKYPINQSVFESTKNNCLSDGESEKKDFITLNKNNFNNTFHFGNYRFDIDDKKLFLDAYKKVLIKNENNIKRNKTMYYNGNNKWIQFKYHHPGKYREFNYKTGGGDLPKKEEVFMAWSCCNNTDKNAKGCQRINLIEFNNI